MAQLSNKVALITGGGRGLGRAIALAYAHAGADVAVASRTRGQIDEVAAAIRGIGRRALAVQVDVSDPQSVAKMVQATQQEFGRIDILVNSAGIGGVERLAVMSDQTWDEVIKINLYGTFYSCREVVRVMIQQKEGSIINIASVAGVKGVPGFSAYAASKSGVIALTQVLALEVARDHVRVNAIAPGYFRTDMNAAALDDPEIGPKIVKRIPLRRVGRPEEIGPLAILLASDDASFITGETAS
jgi:NAD(P)-dependent dehydrogenase (short-subunit alcohol dehydrogenase family)